MTGRKNLDKPLPVRQILGEILKPADWQALELRQKIREAWEDLLPATIRDFCRLRELKGGTLWIEVSSPSVAQELHLERWKIQSRLALKLGSPVVREICFQVKEDAL